MVIFVTKKKLKYALFLLTLSWIAISPPCIASAASPAIERVPAGWVAPEISYVLNEEAERQTIIALETYEEKLILWQNAYDELYQKAENYRLDMESRWAKVMQEIRDMETAHKKELRAARSKARSPGVGVFAGFGYSDGEFNPTVGVGLVWRWF